MALQREIDDKLLAAYRFGEIWFYGGMLYAQLGHNSEALMRRAFDMDYFSDYANDGNLIVTRPKEYLLRLLTQY